MLDNKTSVVVIYSREYLGFTGLLNAFYPLTTDVGSCTHLLVHLYSFLDT